MPDFKGPWVVTPMRAIDDGTFHEVTGPAYAHFLATHPRRDWLRKAEWDGGAAGRRMLYVYDSAEFEKRTSTTTAHRLVSRSPIASRTPAWDASVSGDTGCRPRPFRPASASVSREPRR